jgi:hypothetical protein
MLCLLEALASSPPEQQGPGGNHDDEHPRADQDEPTGVGSRPTWHTDVGGQGVAQVGARAGGSVELLEVALEADQRPAGAMDIGSEVTSRV